MKKSWILILGSLILSVGCVSQEKKQLDEKLAKEAPVRSTREIENKFDQYVEESGLPVEKKMALKSLQLDTRAELASLRDESLKLRTVLIQDIMATTDKTREIGMLKGKIKDVENKRLAVLFSAVERANKIVGRQTEEWQNQMNKMFERNIDNPF